MLIRLLIIWLLTVSTSSFAQTLIVDKKTFSIDSFQTFNGNRIKNVTVGWESYGELNSNKSNVILITHYFSGSSHAAGKYSIDDEKPGYWDAIIGPGKAIDTNKYFVISADTLVNAGVHDKNIITTGPATINPDTGKPYGLSFPVVTIRDFINVQKALLESLGIKKLHAVVGPSMGSLQAIDWASAYPNWVERMISVIGMVEADAWTTAALEQWALPIRLDPNWNNGNYYEKQLPLAGLTASLMLITQQALHPNFINATNTQHSPLESKPLNDINSAFTVVQWLENSAKSRAKLLDANHILYLIRACQLFMTGMDDNLENGLSRIKAKSLFLPATNDLLLMPYMAKKGHDKLTALQKNSMYDEIPGNMGHLDGIYAIEKHATTISQFLSE